MIMPAFMFVGQGLMVVAIYTVGNMVNTQPELLAQITGFTNYIMIIMNAIIVGGMMMSFATRAFVSMGRIQSVWILSQPLLMITITNKIWMVALNLMMCHLHQDDDQPTLKHITFKTAPGEMIGIVGATGSGKSTLAQLIPRIYDPSAGTVKVGGVDLKHANEHSLRETVSFVLQKRHCSLEQLLIICAKECPLHN